MDLVYFRCISSPTTMTKTVQEAVQMFRERNIIGLTGSIRSFLMSVFFVIITVVNFVFTPEIYWFFYPLILWLTLVAFQMYKMLELEGTFGEKKKDKAEAKLHKKAEEYVAMAEKVAADKNAEVEAKMEDDRA